MDIEQKKWQIKEKNNNIFLVNFLGVYIFERKKYNGTFFKVKLLKNIETKTSDHAALNFLHFF